MKRTFCTLLMASALTFPALHAHAQRLGVGVGTNANVSVGTAANSNTQSNTDTRTNGTVTTGSYFAHGDLNSQTVMALQESLNANGYRVNSVNGKLDSSTLTQLQRFEADQGLSASAKSRLNTRTMQQLGVGLQDVDPAAGVSSKTDTRIRSQGNAGAGFNE